MKSGENSIENTSNNENLVNRLSEISDYVRRDAFELVRHAETGHIGGSSSSVELLVSLYFGGRFNFDPDDPDNPDRDLVLIRGHEGPVRYPILSLMGYIDKSELSTYRQFGSRLQGHEDMHLAPGVDITPSGSLGMLLSYGVGAACERKNSETNSRVIVFLGDGEEQEGNVSEAARHASTLPLDNLICVIDRNQKQLSRSTQQVDGAVDLRELWKNYGWNVISLDDGHDIGSILNAYDEIQKITRPTCIIADTTKGRGIEGAEDHYSGYHTYGVTDKDALNKSIDELNTRLATNEAEDRVRLHARDLVRSPAATHDKKSASNEAYDLHYDGDETLDLDDGRERFYTELGSRILSMTGQAPLYMLSPDFIKQPSEQRLGVNDYAHVYHTGIREQHTIAMAHGISAANPDARTIVHYWDSFAFRAMDQINAAAQGGTSMLIAGANSGLFQERNGGTHQSVGQPGGLLNIPGVTMYEPGDTHDLYNVFSRALFENKGVTYARLHSQIMRPLSYDDKDRRNVDAYFVHMPDSPAQATIVASGAMIQNSVDAARILEIEHKVPVNVLNVINQATLQESLVGKLVENIPIITVYNGNPRLLKSSVSGAILGSEDIARPSRVIGIGFERGTTGGIDELERHFGLDARSIALTAMKVMHG